MQIAERYTSTFIFYTHFQILARQVGPRWNRVREVIEYVGGAAQACSDGRDAETAACKGIGTGEDDV